MGRNFLSRVPRGSCLGGTRRSIVPSWGNIPQLWNRGSPEWPEVMDDPTPGGGLEAVLSTSHPCLALHVMGDEGTVKPLWPVFVFRCPEISVTEIKWMQNWDLVGPRIPCGGFLRKLYRGTWPALPSYPHWSPRALEEESNSTPHPRGRSEQQTLWFLPQDTYIILGVWLTWGRWGNRTSVA